MFTVAFGTCSTYIRDFLFDEFVFYSQVSVATSSGCAEADENSDLDDYINYDVIFS